MYWYQYAAQIQFNVPEKMQHTYNSNAAVN